MPDPLKVSIVSTHSQFSFLLRPALPTKCLLSVTSLMFPLSAAAVMERKGDKNKSLLEQQNAIGGLQPISRDTDNNAAMYNCWWKNKRSQLEIFCFRPPTWRL